MHTRRRRRPDLAPVVDHSEEVAWGSTHRLHHRVRMHGTIFPRQQRSCIKTVQEIKALLTRKFNE